MVAYWFGRDRGGIRGWACPARGRLFTNWPYIALGTALAGAGLAAMVYGIVHYRELQAALREEREPHTGEGFLLALAAVGIAVGAVSVLLVLLSP